MEIQHARIWLPLLDGPVYAVVIQRAWPSEPPSQILLRTDIVAREDVQTAETSQQYVLGRPSSYSSQLTKLRECHGVVIKGQTFDVDVASVDSSRQGEQCADLLAAEPNRVIGGRCDSCYIARRWKSVRGLADSMSHVARPSQSIEELETDDQRQLLAGEAVDEGLEHREESRGFHTPEPIGERPQPLVSFGDSIPVAQIDLQSKQSVDGRPNDLPL